MKITCVTCAVRCLDPATVAAAMRGLDDETVARVPYTCRISGQKEEILLLGDLLAARLAATMPEAIDAAGARMLAGLYGTKLCACDLVTLSGLSDIEVADRLRVLAAYGVLTRRRIRGMHYFRLASGNARRAVAAILPN